jgi:hypothetical protein
VLPEEPDDEDGDCVALRGGANPAGVLADPPNDEAPGATGAPGEITVVPGTGAPDWPADGGTSAEGVLAEPPNEDAPGSTGVEGESTEPAPAGICCMAGVGGTSAEGVVTEPPNEDAPGIGWVLSEDCGTNGD